MALGVGLDYAGLDAVQMLFWSAVVNGVLAPPLIVLVVLLTSDRSVMGDHVSPPLLKMARLDHGGGYDRGGSGYVRG